MSDSRRRLTAAIAAAVALVLVGGALAILLPLLTHLTPASAWTIAATASLFSAGVIYALFSRSAPPTPAPHVEQSDN